MGLTDSEVTAVLKLLSEQDSVTVPDDASSFSSSGSTTHDERPTTLFVRNIPVNMTQERLLKIWVPDGSFNLLSLPFSAQTHRSMGNAFLNFVNAEAVEVFFQRWHGRKLTNNAKKLNIVASRIQGLEANVRYIARQLTGQPKHPSFYPAVFDEHGRREFVDVLKAFGPEIPDSLETTTRLQPPPAEAPMLSLSYADLHKVQALVNVLQTLTPKVSDSTKSMAPMQPHIESVTCLSHADLTHVQALCHTGQVWRL